MEGNEMDTSFDDILAEMPLPDGPPIKKVAVESEAQSSSAAASTSDTVVTKPAKQNCVLVNSKQRGNPVLKSITAVPWEWDDIVPDYVVGVTTCILYLSLRYHNLNPDYIHQRLKQLGRLYELRILLVQVDTKDPHNALKHLTRISLLANLTLVLAWSVEEAGKIIETYKMFENKAPDTLMERPEQYPHQKIVSALTNIKPVNKTDAITLLQNFGTLANVIQSSEEKLIACAGLGPRKAKKLHKTFNEPFLK